MSETGNKALVEHFARRIDVPLMIVASAGLLVAAYMLPTLKLTKIIFFTDEYSIWAGIIELWKGKHPILAATVFLFSMVFPIAKLIGLTLAWIVPLNDRGRLRMAKAISWLGKWSMLDVFIVAMIVVLVKSKDLADAEAGIGIYLFAAAVILSMIASMSVEQLSRQLAKIGQPIAASVES
mgnify:CR=1 FL=1